MTSGGINKADRNRLYFLSLDLVELTEELKEHYPAAFPGVNNGFSGIRCCAPPEDLKLSDLVKRFEELRDDIEIIKDAIESTSKGH